MKIKGVLKDVFYTAAEGQVFSVSTDYPLEELINLSGRSLEISIKEWKDGRSLNQNALLWAIIGAIDKNLNGRRSEDGAMDIYKQILKQARVKTEFIQTPVEAKDRFLRFFRVMVELSVKTNHKGNKIGTYECFWGSSLLDTQEFSDVIETALDYAQSIGLNTDIWNRDWNHILKLQKKEGSNGGNKVD